MSKKPTVLMILDGFGLNDKTEGNAVAQAKKPNIDALMKEYPFVKGNASGLAVGLPDGQMGNSEVGHLNMGAGRIVYQELTRITKEINDGEFFSNQIEYAGAVILSRTDKAKPEKIQESVALLRELNEKLQSSQHRSSSFRARRFLKQWNQANLLKMSYSQK